MKNIIRAFRDDPVSEGIAWVLAGGVFYMVIRAFL